MQFHRPDVPRHALEGVDLALGVRQTALPERGPYSIDADRVIAVEVEQQLAVQRLIPSDPL